MINHNSLMDEATPFKFHLSQNYPNPFSEKTIIKYCVAYKTRVQITVYDNEEKEIVKLVDEKKNPGTYEVVFSVSHSRKGGNLKDGYNYYIMTAGDYSSEKKWLCINKLSGRLNMKNLLQFLFFFLLVAQIGFAQWYQQNNNGVETAWVQHYGSEKVASSDQTSSLTLDVDGNLYVTGMSGGDIVTIKYNADGDTLWTTRYDALGSYGQWLPCSVVVDHLGNVYIAGGSDTYFGDYLTIKYSAEGNIVWVRTYNGPTNGGDYATGIAVDEELNVYVIGARRIMQGQWDAQEPYVIKYNQVGDISWQRVIPSNSSIAREIHIALDQDKNVLITEFSTTTKLNRNTGTTIWVNSYYPSYSWIQCLAVDRIGNVYINEVVEQPGGSDYYNYVTIKYNASGMSLWMKSHAGPGRDLDGSSAIAVDSSGNVYVTGSSSGQYATKKFDINGNIIWSKNYTGPGDGGSRPCALAVDAERNVYVTGSDKNDFATIKYDENGNVIWVHRFDGYGHSTDNATSLILDNSGSIYVTGGSVGEASDFDYTIVKYTTNGDISWVRQYNGIPSSYDYASSLAVDITGNAYLTGRSRSTTTGDDYATVKYNASGNLVWTSRFAGFIGKEDRASDISVDFDRNVYVTGKSEDSDTSSSIATIKYSSDGSLLWLQKYNNSSTYWEGNSFLNLDDEEQVYVTGTSEDGNVTLKYSSGGNSIWTSRYHFPGDFYEATSMAVDVNGNAYVTGYAGTGGWLWRTSDYATIKYNANGDSIWARIYDYGLDGTDEAKSLAVDEFGNVYVTGSSDGSETGRDYATLKYTPSGDTLWVQRYDGLVNGYDEAKALSLDQNGNLFVIGVSEGLNGGWDYTTIKYNNNGDVLWVKRYNHPGRWPEEPVATTVDVYGSVYVIGSIDGGSGDRDIVTIKYSSSGDEEWIARYDAAEKLNWIYSDDYATAIEVNLNGDVFVCGYSENSQQGKSVYTLIKYIQIPSNIEYERLLGPETFVLFQNYPNPFNPSTIISYQLPMSDKVTLKVFDLLGREVATLVDEYKPAGSYEVELKSTVGNHQLASGIYYYQLSARDFIQTKKMILLK